MTGNVLLAARMAAAGLQQQELADALNRRIEEFTGRLGTVSDRQVRNWLTGKTRSREQDNVARSKKNSAAQPKS
ncbi:hypothetical protein ACWDZ6_24570 [Streptomyces sp. NPDC002926]